MDPKDAAPSLRIGFTDQRLTAHGGLIVWSHFLRQKRCRQQLRELLPHDPARPNAYDPADVALGYVGGVLCGADTLSRVAGRQSDPAVAQVRGVEAVASQARACWCIQIAACNMPAPRPACSWNSTAGSPA